MKALKRLPTLFFVVLILLFLLPSQLLAATFPDIDGHWAEDEIEYLAGLGVVNGLPDGTFGVSQNMTRAQVATLLTNQLGLAGQPASFPDVASTHWAYQAIGAAANAGIMSGFPDGNFYPNEPLTRAQAATVIANAYQFTGTATAQTFSDVGTGHWAFANIDAMVENYITTGYPDGTFKPNQNVSRAEFSVFIARSLDISFTQSIQLMNMTATIVQLLSDEDMAALQAYIHPVQGVRFSPYNYVDNAHLVFQATSIPGFLADTTQYTWGTQDGSGDPIIKTPQEYFDRYVMNKDYTNPDDIQYNNIVVRGSLLYNIDTFYPNGTFVEYFVDGTSMYSYMDWGSLFIVYEYYQGDWYVVAIIHGEWTI